MFEVEFKDVKGYEDFYSISINGIVRSKRYNKILKHDIGKNKIHSVRIIGDNGKSLKTSVIRLMALTFLENPNSDLYNYAINKNGNHNDLRIENILWATSSIQVVRKNKRYPEIKKKFIDSSIHINTRKMTDSMINDLYTMRELGYSVKQLTQIFPIKKCMIFRYLKNKTFNTKMYV